MLRRERDFFSLWFRNFSRLSWFFSMLFELDESLEESLELDEFNNVSEPDSEDDDEEEDDDDEELLDELDELEESDVSFIGRAWL